MDDGSSQESGQQSQTTLLPNQEKSIGNKVLQVAVQPLRNEVHSATYSKKGETMVKDVIMLRRSHVFRPAGHTVNVIYPTRRMRAVGESDWPGGDGLYSR